MVIENCKKIEPVVVKLCSKTKYTTFFWTRCIQICIAVVEAFRGTASTAIPKTSGVLRLDTSSSTLQPERPPADKLMTSLTWLFYDASSGCVLVFGFKSLMLNLFISVASFSAFFVCYIVSNFNSVTEIKFYLKPARPISTNVQLAR